MFGFSPKMYYLYNVESEKVTQGKISIFEICLV